MGNTRIPDLEKIVRVFRSIRSPFDMRNACCLSFRLFEQIWGNSALGFDIDGYLSCQVMTYAYTVVVSGYIGEQKVYGVFFDEELAYIVDKPNKLFFQDLERGIMKSVSKAKLYE